MADDEKKVDVTDKVLQKSKGVVWCSGYVVGVDSYMDCTGDITGQTTPYKLLHAQWKLNTPIPGANKFILVFTK